ncbi:MAG TPA: deaminase [Trueperaceae bacterium]|nr:deaminase [Trueperaceae bacterium]
MSSQDKWDIRFLQLAEIVAQWSRDPSTKCGAVIVRPDRTVASLGFNGFPRGMYDAEALYHDRDEKYSRVVHAEINAVLHAHGPVAGCTLYTWPFCCCDRCAVQMIQAGITRVVSPSLPADKAERWERVLIRSLRYFQECGVEVTLV